VIFVPLILLTGLALWLARYLIRHDKGEREATSVLWRFFWYGIVAAIMAGILEAFLIPSKYVASNGQPPYGLGLLLAALAIGFIEEACKFIPAARRLYRMDYFNEHTDGILYFAIVGLGFGLPENILYTLTFGAGAGFGRVLLTPFFHAATTGIVGYYLIRVKLDKKPKIEVALALLFVAAIHGLYDFGLLSGRPLLVLMSLGITLALTVSLFVIYRQAGQADTAGLPQIVR
jgi:RsiW-degrading membrane proteinase PrsW (M82 family)